MTKAQALALANALEGRGVPFGVLLRIDAGGVSVWSVQLDTSHAYAGADLAALAAYCSQNGLALSAQFAALGIV